MLNEFKAFIMRGNVIDLAVGVIIGAAFGVIVSSLVDDVIMPPIGLLLGNVDFSNLFFVIKDGTPAGPYATLAAAKSSGAVSVNYGVFMTKLVSFLITSFAIFMLVKVVNNLHKKEDAAPAAPTTKTCPLCLMEIPIKATKCGHCTSAVAS